MKNLYKKWRVKVLAVLFIIGVIGSFTQLTKVAPVESPKVLGASTEYKINSTLYPLTISTTSSALPFYTSTPTPLFNKTTIPIIVTTTPITVTSTINYSTRSISTPSQTTTSIPTQNVSSDDNRCQTTGAHAICFDETYSYSQHNQGTCSHHHGVRYWCY